MGYAEQKTVREEANERVRLLGFGDPVTNICAGKNNPNRHGYFVERIKRSGNFNNGTWVRCTDKKGNFWEMGTEVAYSGHLDYEECERLFKPVWEARYQ